MSYVPIKNTKQQRARNREEDLRQLEDVMNDSDGRMVDKKDKSISAHIQNKQPLDSASALQAFLNHIPISSIPGIKNSPGIFIIRNL